MINISSSFPMISVMRHRAHHVYAFDKFCCDYKFALTAQEDVQIWVRHHHADGDARL